MSKMILVFIISIIFLVILLCFVLLNYVNKSKPNSLSNVKPLGIVVNPLSQTTNKHFSSNYNPQTSDLFIGKWISNNDGITWDIIVNKDIFQTYIIPNQLVNARQVIINNNKTNIPSTGIAYDNKISFQYDDGLYLGTITDDGKNIIYTNNYSMNKL
jgi:hypothetical protein